jgi:prephenate dehydratase
MKIAYQGVAGAFSHQACLAFMPDYDPVPQPSFEAVASAVLAGEADCGMLPLENNQAGPVAPVQRLLASTPLARVEEHVLPIRIHLLARAGARMEDIRIAVSHPVALRQCAQSLARLGLQTEEADNTAVAASTLRDPHKAALASEAAAQAHGLIILMRDLHDRPDNATRFAIVKRQDG